MAGTFWYNATVLLSDPICFHTCLLVCSQLVSLFLYLHCDSSLWALSVKGISLSPVPHFSLHCSVFFVLVALGTGLKSHLFSYSSLYFTLTCGCSLWVLQGHSMLHVLCLSPCLLSPLFSPTHALTAPPLSLLFFCLGAYLDTWFSPVPHLSSLVPSNVYTSFPPHCCCCWEKNGFPGLLCFSLPFFLCSGHIPLPSVSTTCYPTYLPTCLQLVSLSSLHYRASFQVSSIWEGEDSFSPLSFLSFLVPVVFPSAFFTSLLIPVVLAFGTQDSPCLPCVPICVLIQPVFSYLLCCLGFRTFGCFWGP